MDKLKEMTEDIKAGWEKMEKAKRIRLVSIVVSILFLIGLLAFLSQRTEYKVLFNDLDDEDAGAIVADIESKGMKYKLDNNGTTILIDEDEIDTYRIELAVDGLLPSSSAGFEIFDGANMMATDDDRAIMYQRAVSGELEQAISSLETVKSAKILLNLPEDSVFQNPEYRREASASVVLEMRTTQLPDSETIQGIASLVSGAVENLPTSNVEIVDTKGNLLSTSSSGGAGDSTVVSAHQKIKKSIETELEHKVINLLAPIYGSEKVHVSVNTDLNFDAVEREDVNYQVPEGSETGQGLIRSQTEHVSGNAGLSAIVQGSVLDEETITEFLEDEDEGNSSTYDHTTNYELDSSTSRIIQAPGRVERVTASVIIRAPQGTENLNLLVRNALGIDEAAAAETIEIEFIGEPVEDGDELLMPGLELGERVLTWVGNNWWMLVVALVLVILVITLARTLGDPAEIEVVEELEEYDEYEPKVAEKPVVEEVDEEVIDQEMEAKIRAREVTNEKEDEVRDHARENPELVAELLKVWLNEEKE